MAERRVETVQEGSVMVVSDVVGPLSFLRITQIMVMSLLRYNLG